MSGKAGQLMEGQMCLFSSNRQWERSNQPPLTQTCSSRDQRDVLELAGSTLQHQRGTMALTGRALSDVCVTACAAADKVSLRLDRCLRGSEASPGHQALSVDVQSVLGHFFFLGLTPQTSIIIYILQTYKCIMFALRFVFALNHIWLKPAASSIKHPSKQ